MRYIAVARVSSTGQVENTSIGNQLEVIHQYAQDQLYEKVGEYVDQDARTTYLERAELQKALEKVRQREADLIIFYDVTRIGVDLVIRQFIEDLYKAGGKLALATERRIFRTKDDAITETILTGAVSTFEYAQITRRTNQGKRRAVALGGYLGKVAFGYKLETVIVQGSKIRKPVVDDVEAGVVQEVLEALIEGEGRYTLSTRLNEKYKGLLNYKFNYNFIKRIEGHLPKYIGGVEERTWNVGGEELEMRVEFPRIISDETYNKVTKALHFAAKNNANPKKHTTPFRRIVYCTCGEFCTNGGRRYGQVTLTCNSYHKFHYKKSQGTLDGTEKYCAHSINHRAIRTEVIRFIKNDFDHTFFFLEDTREKVVETLDDFSALLKEAQKEQTETKDALLKADPETLVHVAAVFNEKLDKIGRRVFYLNRKVEETKADLQRVDTFVGNTYKDNLKDVTENAIRLMEGEAWEEANSLLYDLGLMITLDCSKATLEDKSKPVPVFVDFDYNRVIHRLVDSGAKDYKPRVQVDSVSMYVKRNNKVPDFLQGVYDFSG